MLLLVDLGIGVLILGVASLILGIGIKLVKEANKSDKKDGQ